MSAHKRNCSNRLSRSRFLRANFVPLLSEKLLSYHTGNPHLAQSKNPRVRFFSKTVNRKDLKVGTRIPELLCYAPIKTELSRDPQPGAISTGSDPGRPNELVGEARNKLDKV